MSKAGQAEKSLRLILVDDDSRRAAIVQSSLVKGGFCVLSIIPTGSGLLHQMAQYEPDVVIIALDSPDRDVLESLSIASAHNPKPVVMFSGAGDSGFITDAIAAGVSAYQTENLSAERVKAAIDVAVAQFSAYDTLKRELVDTRRQLKDRKIVERAKGLLMSLHNISEDQAFSTLRTLAMDKNETLGQACQGVVTLLEKPGKNGAEQ